MSELTPLSFDDYDAIEAAVEETERGRWFLTEYARRNRHADTQLVLAAIAGLEARLAISRPAGVGPARTDDGAATLIREAMSIADSLRTGPRRANETFDRLDQALRRALAAVGGASETTEPKPERASEAIAPLMLAGPVIDDDERREEPGPQEDPGPIAESQVEEAETVDWAVAEEPATAEFEPAADAPSIVSDDAAAERAPAPAPPPTRPRLPAAHTPLLLDSLSEAERAILFA